MSACLSVCTYFSGRYLCSTPLFSVKALRAGRQAGREVPVRERAGWQLPTARQSQAHQVVPGADHRTQSAL